MSHPAWVRELKPTPIVSLRGQSRESHPAWVRELKRSPKRKNEEIQQVAPRVGA